MSKTMSQTIRGHNPKLTRVIALLAVLVLMVVALASMLQPAATTGASNPGIHAMSSAGGSSFSQDDPYIERHAEVVARYHQGSLR
jgi:hypothetical protein